MRIAFAQIDPVVGAFAANVGKIKEAYTRACSEGARVLLTPELGICGYPPHDLVERPEMFDRNELATEELRALTRGQKCALVVGHVVRTPSNKGHAAQNVVSVFEDGKQVFRQAKTLLPTYDVFDEARYFQPAEKSEPWICDGHKVALAICEDFWARDPALGRELYSRDPVTAYEAIGVDLVISISASPYVWEKRIRREELHANVARTLKAPLLYVNQVGANDEVLFDGGSFACDAQGKLVGRLPLFRKAFGWVDIDLAAGKGSWVSPAASEREDTPPSEIEVLSRALVTGIHDYFTRSGFKTAILGLSGGIDSAVVATLAARALGPRNVLGVAMPSQYSSGHSLEDAEILARNLGINFEVRPIKFLFSQFSRELGESRGGLAPLALENLQARLRGTLLMTLSNHYSALVLTTGNKSELATGYCTLYGDMCGALAPIGDVFKTRVYELARHLNATSQGTAAIPERSITKPPSAELRPGQVDQDTLPPYPQLDALLTDYLEKGLSLEQLRSTHDPGQEKSWIPPILRMIDVSEYKRRQAPPVLKVSPKAFGIGRRIPIAKNWIAF
ncbi:MAG: NAD+ synthase [Oligoflexia bacterium]|nr:NAD+ synthase [Oligoflexia bacterium]